MKRRNSRDDTKNGQRLEAGGTRNSRDASPIHQKLTEDTVYGYYSEELLPAIMASLPVLIGRMAADSTLWLRESSVKVLHFLLPFLADDNYRMFPPNLAEMWEQTMKLPSSARTSAVSDFMLDHFDTNGDGSISPSELINMTEIMSKLRSAQTPQSFWSWFSREWPLMDWKVAVFLWRSFGGLLLVLCILSVVPGRLHRLSGMILRWPILGLTYSLIFVELIVYIVIRLGIRLAEALIARPKHRTLRKSMGQAKSYEEWYQYAAALDVSKKRDKWQRRANDDTSYRYNWTFIRNLMTDLKNAREKKDSLLALAVLQQCTRKNVGGIMSEELFSYTNTGEPKLIVKQFVDEVTATLRWITNEAVQISEFRNGDESHEMEKYEKKLEQKVRKEKTKIWKSVVDWATLNFSNVGVEHEEEEVPPKALTRSIEFKRSESTGSVASEGLLPLFHKERLISFLKRARAAYGRTALCLSGGAMAGLYHFGHIKALLETDCLPHIISGTSAGSVVAAVVCTRTDEEIERDMTPEAMGHRIKCFSRSWPDRLRSVYNNGTLFDRNEWLDMIKWFTCGDMTFEEAYNKTGRVFCITLCSTTKKAPPVLLNYISAPNVTIASAVIASAAVPGFIEPVQLQFKDSDGNVLTKEGESYFDGSIETDIPINGLAEMLNCQFFIACQCNPHVAPFFFDPTGGVGRPSRWSSGEHEHSWRGGFLLAALEMYLKNDMKSKFVFLKDLEAAVGFTSTMMTQEFVGSTTIVPHLKFTDYFKLFSDPDPNDLHRYFHGGSIAAYQHVAMIRLHYSIADAIDECLEKLEGDHVPGAKFKRMSMKETEKIAETLAGLDKGRPRRISMPSVVVSALRERFEEVSSTDSSDGDY